MKNKEETARESELSYLEWKVHKVSRSAMGKNV